MKTKWLSGSRTRWWLLAALAPLAVQAAEWEASGFLREEISVRSGTTNPFNQQGNPFNGKSVRNTGLGPLLAPGVSPDTLTRPGNLTNANTFNMFATRLELSLDGRLNDNLSAHVKLRGFYDGVGQIDSAFRDKNIFEQELYSHRGGTPLERAGKDWMLDLPAAYLDYSNGPLWVRFGNQQIAWGESIFFRVLDVPNGLDLRRHSILDVVAEEYSDKRVPSLALRASYRTKNDWEIEGFGQQFRPSIVPGENSPYNNIPTQFKVQEREAYQKVKDDWTFGGRVRGQVGKFGVQFMAVNRRNPDGVIRWADSKAGALSGTAFEAGTGQGIYSAEEWFEYASLVGLNGPGGLETALNEFPVANAIGQGIALGCGGTNVGGIIGLQAMGSASCVLDTFFDPVIGMGNLRGHITREYPRETVLGFSVNHVFEADPDSVLDQLVARFELSYTPNKKFTNPTLSRNYLEKNETQFALILEKYHKFSADLPATYIVGQWLHKDQSDLFGRHLSGLNNKPGERPKGLSQFNALALSVQQPSKTLAWRTDLTVLTDLRGGWLIQPGVKWKPNKSFQLDLYGNVIKTDGGNDDFGSVLKYGNEVFMRGTYYF